MVSHASLATVLAGYTDHQVYADNRPLTVTVPLSQALSLQVIYGTELISIPVTQSYTLNATYNPTRLQDEQAACDEKSRQFGFAIIKILAVVLGIAVIAVLVVVGMIVWLLSWILRRSRR